MATVRKVRAGSAKPPGYAPRSASRVAPRSRVPSLSSTPLPGASRMPPTSRAAGDADGFEQRSRTVEGSAHAREVRRVRRRARVSEQGASAAPTRDRGHRPGRTDNHPRPGKTRGGNLRRVVGTSVANDGDRPAAPLRELRPRARRHRSRRRCCGPGRARRRRASSGGRRTPRSTPPHPGPPRRRKCPCPRAASSIIEGAEWVAGVRSADTDTPQPSVPAGGHRTDRHAGPRRGRLSAVCRPQTPGSRLPRRAGWH